MNASLLAIVDAFTGLEVLVVGDPMLDDYLHGVAHQICREAPAPVVRVASRSFAPGGAANVVVNTQALGGRATLLGVIGDDPEGQHLAELLEQRGVSTEHLLRQEGRQTLAKRRVMAGAHLVVRFDEGSTEPIDERTEAALLERLTGLYPRADAVIVPTTAMASSPHGWFRRWCNSRPRRPAPCWSMPKTWQPTARSE